MDDEEVRSDITTDIDTDADTTSADAYVIRHGTAPCSADMAFKDCRALSLRKHSENLWNMMLWACSEGWIRSLAYHL